MLKQIHPVTVAFDCEWVPDAATIRRIYELGDNVSDADSIERAFAEARSAPEEKQPYLKPVMCRIVSICAVIRKSTPNGAELKLVMLPNPADPSGWDEARIIRSFLSGVGKNSAQLVGFNCLNADIPALVQRSLVNALPCPEFGRRPEKPWEGPDYFSAFSDHVFDVGKAMAFGRQMPTLHQAATACRIPGKFDASGDQVYDLWRQGRQREIIAYNSFDALTTYLLWLRCALFSGLISENDLQAEQASLTALLEREAAAGHEFLNKYLERWRGLTTSIK